MRVGDFIVKKRKLNYRFHNPNTAEMTANYIAGLFVEVNTPKIQAVIQAAAEKIKEQETQDESHSVLAG